MKITVVKEFTFDAAHQLLEHPGKCKQLHGHTYRLQIGITGPIDESTGMVMDFAGLKNLINDKIVDRLDHQFLNNIDYAGFPAHQSTAERMVFWIWSLLSTIWQISDPINGRELSFIRLYETPTSYAEWRKE